MKALVIAAILLAPAAAHAFPTGDQFDMDALEEDGAGGVAFTGAPRWAGHTCDVCHTGAQHRIGLAIEADPFDIFTAGYEPGRAYHMRVVLKHEWLGLDLVANSDGCGGGTPYHACDDNGFAIELDDLHGKPVGTLSPLGGDGTCNTAPTPPNDIRVLDDGTAAMQSGVFPGQAEWDFCWTAPGAGTGALTAYLTAVDGNGGDGSEANPNDPIGDDVAAGSVPLAEKGAAPGTTESGGCSAAGDGSLATALVALLALGALRRRRAAAALVLALGASACAHVKPQQREYLSERKMVFGPDPAEDELDLHMQESREGSAGGYGSAGGGCGCN